MLNFILFLFSMLTVSSCLPLNSLGTPIPPIFTPGVRSPYEIPPVQLQSNGIVPILKSDHHRDNSGTYSFSYESGDGTTQHQSGHQIGADVVKEGVVSWTSPEGLHFQLSFKADKDGYRAVAAHLPTVPPVPQEIVESLSLNSLNARPKEIHDASVMTFRPNSMQPGPDSNHRP